MRRIYYKTSFLGLERLENNSFLWHIDYSNEETESFLWDKSLIYGHTVLQWQNLGKSDSVQMCAKAPVPLIIKVKIHFLFLLLLLCLILPPFFPSVSPLHSCLLFHIHHKHISNLPLKAVSINTWTAFFPNSFMAYSFAFFKYFPKRNLTIVFNTTNCLHIQHSWCTLPCFNFSVFHIIYCLQI